MAGLDKTDMLLNSTESVRKSTKWYEKVFFHILDLAVLNIHAIYKIVSGKKFPLLDCQRQLVKEIIEKLHRIKPQAY